MTTESVETETSDVQRFIEHLPSGVALFGDDGILLEANAVFIDTLPVGTPHRFDALFGAEPALFARGERSTVDIGEQHFALNVRAVSGWGWLCQLHDVSRWVRARAEARDAAARDALTGLPNRSVIEPEIARAAADGSTSVALLMIDLDRFKLVNDTLGHAVGDALLKKVAQRLTASLRPGDVVARLGGDEFAVMQTATVQPAGSEALAKRLVEVLGRPYVVDGHMIDIDASIGVAVAGGDQPSTDGETLFKQADIALYRAKDAGRARFTFFEQRMDDAMQQRRQLELDLRRALAFRQFELHYQPQVGLVANQVTGMEALIRWNHPERGMISPAAFIPIAEETGLIVPIGEWVIRQACDDASHWPEAIAVAVNVSAKQLASGKLVGTIAQAIANAGIAPQRFEVEITESVLMSDTQGCVETLHALRALGVRVSMDDFGTGYSSLSYLSSFPFDTIKIDQSFTQSNDSAKSEAIIRAIAAIGHHLGMTTIAEGVETQAQMTQLAASGCGSVQGFFISRPVPAHDVAKLLAQLQSDPSTGRPNVAPTAVPALPGENLYRLVYYSTNMILGVDEEVRASVDDILRTSQVNNARVGVTGALMFTDGYFAQVLEGDRAQIEQVFERIQLDDRHGDVKLLSFSPVGARVFPAWSMAFVGHDEAGRGKFGHYAASSGFDFAAADSDKMIMHLRALLVDEEKLSFKQAA